jgi:hypothetical protein
MLSDVCSVLVDALAHGKEESSFLVRRFVDGVRGYIAEPFEYPKSVLEKLIERAEAYLDQPSEATLVRLVLAAKTAQEFYDMPSAYYEKLGINRPQLAVNDEGTLVVRFSEEPYQPPPEPTEKEIGQTKDLLGRLREAAGNEPEQ